MNYQELFYRLDTRPYSKERLTRYRKALKQHFDCPSWTTKDGRIIPMDLMRDSHLENAFWYQIRAVRELYGKSCNVPLMSEAFLHYYLDALKVKDSLRFVTSAQARHGFEPTERELNALRGMELTLKHWMPTSGDLDFEDNE